MEREKGDVSLDLTTTPLGRETAPSGTVVVGPAQNWAAFRLSFMRAR
jgi:hypothetical protein